MAGPTIKYEDFTDANFTLGNGQAKTAFIRSNFDYGARQRRAVRDYEKFSVRMVLDSTEMDEFETFWAALNDGTDKFYTDQVINGDETTDKIVRFTAPYTPAQIGAFKFTVTCPIELIQTGV